MKIAIPNVETLRGSYLGTLNPGVIPHSGRLGQNRSGSKYGVRKRPFGLREVYPRLFLWAPSMGPWLLRRAPMLKLVYNGVIMALLRIQN